MGLISRVSSRTYRGVEGKMLRACSQFFLLFQNRFMVNSISNSICIQSREIHTTPELEHKRHIIYQRRRRKRRRYLKLHSRYADQNIESEKQKKSWYENREKEDLKNVWLENGLTSEPPQLSPSKKREILYTWFKTGKIHSIMTHEELCDYNLGIPIKAGPTKVQPVIWRGGPNNPRHKLEQHADPVWLARQKLNNTS